MPNADPFKCDVVRGDSQIAAWAMIMQQSPLSNGLGLDSKILEARASLRTHTMATRPLSLLSLTLGFIGIATARARRQVRGRHRRAE